MSPFQNNYLTAAALIVAALLVLGACTTGPTRPYCNYTQTYKDGCQELVEIPAFNGGLKF